VGDDEQRTDRAGPLAVPGDHVELGKFLDVVVLVLSLMITRELARRAYNTLGAPEPSDSQESVDSP
jgi:hypothetical protein